VILWGSNWICRFRLHPRNSLVSGSSKRRREDENDDTANEDDEEEEETEEEEEEPPSVPPAATVGKKEGRTMKDRIRGSQEGELFFSMVTRYRNVLGVEFISSDEMVVVERPLLDVLSTLPPAYFKAKYGT
jgi:U3 small nucleolar RNA-associated protein 4